jgi:hypothetical protein
MSTTIDPKTPQGNLPAIGIPLSQDYPRLVYTSPYFETVALAELIEPSVIEAVESALPGLVPPYVQDAANAAVAQQAVMLTGSTMSGPLFLNPVLPVQPSQAASMAYVDLMISTAGVPEVPPTPIGQTWARQTGQWVPFDPQGGLFLPLTGGAMQGQINMSGNGITNLPALPQMPNGAAPAEWVLNQIAAQSLYQGTWTPETNTPDLTLPGNNRNGFTWIVVTASPGGVVVTFPIPGLQGLTVYNGDNVIFSAIAGQFQIVRSGGLSLAEAEALFLPFTGGQMSGPLMLNANATSAMQATTLQQVQALAAFPESPSDGQLYGRQGLTQSWMPVLPLGGGVLSGQLTLAANAVQPLNAVPLQQLNSTLGAYVPLAGNATIIGPLTMSGAGANLTLNSNAAANLQPVPLQQMNSVLATYASQAYVQTAVAPALNNVGRNLIHNSMFNIAQRGLGPFTTSLNYTADRWQISFGGGDADTVTVVPLGDPDHDQIGDEATSRGIYIVFTGNAAAGSYSQLVQMVEGVKRLSGKTAIVSFWARAASGTLMIGMNAVQNFGTGGSPSGQVQALATGNSVTIGTTWARYSSVIPMPSVDGKILGTDGNDYTQIPIWLSAGASNNAPAGNIGVQSGTVTIWGVQLEIAQPGQTQPTPLEKPDPRYDLANCQRFYQNAEFIYEGYQVAGQVVSTTRSHVAAMRASPSVNVRTGGQNNISNLINYTFSTNAQAMWFRGFAVTSAQFTLLIDLVLSADL